MAIDFTKLLDTIETDEELIEHFKNDPYGNIDRQPSTIKVLMGEYYDGTLELHPTFQRPYGVWSKKLSISWIYSIIMGIQNTGQIVLNDCIIDERKKLFTIDGQQRLTTIVHFIKGDKKGVVDVLPKTFPIKPCAGKRYEELPSSVKNRIMNASLSTFTYKNLSEKEMSIIFIAAQQGKSLSTMDLRNALPLSESRNNLAKHQEHCIFSDIKKIKNKHHIKEIILRTLLIVDNDGEPCDLTSESLTKFYINRLGDLSLEANSRAKFLLDFVYGSMKDSGRLEKLNFGLLTHLIYLVQILETKYSLSFKNKNDKIVFGKAVDRFFPAIQEATNSREVDKELCRRWSKKDVVSDNKFFMDIINKYTHFILLDPLRSFSDYHKEMIYRNANGRCANKNCVKKLSINEGEYHHIKAWKKGGKTVIDNGQFLCKDCHKFISKHGKLPTTVINRKVLGKINPLELINEK